MKRKIAALALALALCITDAGTAVASDTIDLTLIDQQETDSTAFVQTDQGETDASVLTDLEAADESAPAGQQDQTNTDLVGETDESIQADPASQTDESLQTDPASQTDELPQTDDNSAAWIADSENGAVVYPTDSQNRADQGTEQTDAAALDTELTDADGQDTEPADSDSQDQIVDLESGQTETDQTEMNQDETVSIVGDGLVAELAAEDYYDPDQDEADATDTDSDGASEDSGNSDTSEIYYITEPLEDSGMAENASLPLFSMFSRVEYDGSYGSQLDEFSQTVYSSMKQNFVTEPSVSGFSLTISDCSFEMPYSAADAKVLKTQGKLTSEESWQDGILMLKSSFQSAYDALLFDEPYAYWVKPVMTYALTITGEDDADTCTITITRITIKNSSTYTSMCTSLLSYKETIQSAVSEAVQSLQAQITDTTTRQKKILLIHDYLCSKVSYDYSYSNYNSTEIEYYYMHTILGAFTDVNSYKVVCDGYAKSFKLLCDLLGIPCAVIPGYAGDGHAWNAVQMEDGQWYLIDTTWDDLSSGIRYIYFLAGTESVGSKNTTIAEERTAYTVFSGTNSSAQSFVVPTIAETAYHEHEWGEYDELYQAATCGGDEIMQAVCIYPWCEETDLKTVEGTATGEHTYTEVKTEEEPTCTEEGVEATYCSVCGAKEAGSEQPTDALGHLWDDGTVTQAATCIATGLKTYKCTRNGCSETKTETLPFTDHQYTVTKTDQEPTCTETGVESTHCSVCDTKEAGSEKPIDALGHLWDDGTVTQAATCTETGVKVYKCIRDDCTIEKTEEIAALGHSWDNGTVTKEPTCTETGIKAIYCSVCGAEKAESEQTIEALGHSWDDGTITKAATCTETGVKVYKCIRDDCTAEKTEEIAALGHSWGDDTITKAATCTEAGEKASYCSVCNAIKPGSEQTIEALGHSWDAGTVTQAATCTETGVKVYKCIRDDCIIEKTETIEALGHSWDNGTVTKAATCTETGLKVYSCTRTGCTAEQTETLAKTAHQYTIIKTVQMPTCTEKGIKCTYCSVCGTQKADSEQTIAALGHIWNNGTVTKTATCTETGLKVYSCTRTGCTAEQTETLAKTAHQYTITKTMQTPTCTEKGIKCTYCSVCGTKKAESEQPIAALGHSYTTYVSNRDATVLKNGTKTAVCDNGCGQKKTVTESGSKLIPTMKLSATKVSLSVGQSTTAITVSGLARGDAVKSWSSSKPTVASVNSKGKITGLKSGTAKIKIKLKSGKIGYVTVTVKKVTTRRITKVPSRLTLKIGKKTALKPQLVPVTSQDTISYRSSNKKIATVTSKGVITARKKGTATITVKAGKITVKCRITVK
jgi:hypothetical protein